MNKYSLSAMIAAGLLAGSAASASAADLGGNCCADLEERIAELEATTARKGNRKVSLTISGWVAEQVLWWDDGRERNMYVTGLGATLASNFKFTGEANIRPGLKAGYVMHIEVNTSDPLTVHQGRDDGPYGGQAVAGSNGLAVLQSYWYLKDNHLGQVSVGQLSPASDNAAILVDGSGSLAFANWVLFDNLSFGINAGGGPAGISWGQLARCHYSSAGLGGDCVGVPMNAVRYDSPTFGGFSASASWGEDDFWDVTGRFAGEFAGFKLAFAASYAERNDNTVVQLAAAGKGDAHRVGYFQAGAYIQHVPTGLFAYGAYGQEHTSSDMTAKIDHNPDHWYVKAGIRQKFMPLGHTVLFGEYANRNNMIDPALVAAPAIVSASSNMTQWGLGLVQEIDAAAMSLFVVYRNFDAEATVNSCVAGAAALICGTNKANFDSMQIIKAGALISF